MGFKTPLFAEHRGLGARMVPFGGWEMPLHYGSQIEEHHCVRRDAGMFDVSHMLIVDVDGREALLLLRILIANDAAKLVSDGQALYGCMLNENGGVIDDLIVYRRGVDCFRIVVNAATADKDTAWIRTHASGFDTTVRLRRDLAMIAVQGPNSRTKAIDLLPGEMRESALELENFTATETGDWFAGRTGYTGEDGVEILCPADAAVPLWRALITAGVSPCGLGARDTLRLEAGMNLYGQDMDESVGPLESGLGWTVAWSPPDREFIGRRSLEAQREREDLRRLVGLLLIGRGVLREGQQVISNGDVVGETTSGGFSPTLGRSVAFARVKADIAEECTVLIRGKPVAAKVVKRPFVRNGRPCVDL